MPPPKRLKVASITGLFTCEERQLHFSATGSYEVAAMRTLYTVTCYDSADEEARNVVLLGGSRIFSISLRDCDKNQVAAGDFNYHICSLIRQKALEKYIIRISIL
jgi:hypothetical protein